MHSKLPQYNAFISLNVVFQKNLMFRRFTAASCVKIYNMQLHNFTVFNQLCNLLKVTNLVTEKRLRTQTMMSCL